MEKFKFTPEVGFLDGTEYPNPASENETREQLQRPLNQLKDYLNSYVDHADETFVTNEKHENDMVFNLVPYQAYEFTPAEISFGDKTLYTHTIKNSTLALDGGETYYVEWDGTLYTCISQFTNEANTAVLVGSQLLLVEEEFPFMVQYNLETKQLTLGTFEAAGTHYVRIYQKMADVLNNVYKKNESDYMYQPKGNYLTEVPQEYITESELEAKNYLTEHQDLSEYIKTKDADGKYQPIGNYQPKGDYVTKDENKYFEIRNSLFTISSDFDPSHGGNIGVCTSLQDFGKLVLGHTYRVELNGKKSTHVAFKTNLGVAIGNQLLTGDNFLIEYRELTDDLTLYTSPDLVGYNNSIEVYRTFSTSAKDYYSKAEVDKKLNELPKPTTSWNELTDKPFEVTGNEFVVTIPSQTLEFSYSENYDDYFQTIKEQFLVENKNYKVIWDGTEYRCVCKKHVTETNSSTITGHALYLGNGAIAELEGVIPTEQPFYILEAYINGGKIGDTTIRTLDSSSTHTIEIQSLEEVVKQLDPKFVDGYTKKEIDEKLKDLPTEEVDLSNYYSKTQSDLRYQRKGDYLEEVPEEYVTEDELNGKGYLTEIPSNYVTDDKLTERLNNLDTGATSWNDLEDKPFYSEGSVVEVLPSQNLTFTNLGNGLFLCEVESRLFMLEDGKTYIVNWDGTQYECVAFATSFEGMNGIGIGNKSLAGIGDDTQEPFLFGCFLDFEATACYTIQSGTSHNVSITLNDELVHQLESKYIPADYIKQLIDQYIGEALEEEV